MVTLREFIRDQSLLDTGNLVRDHLQNPGGYKLTVLGDGLEIEMELAEVDIEIDLDEMDIEVETYSYDIEIDMSEYDVEVG